MVDTSDEWIVKKTGIRERRILNETETTSDLAARACESILEAAGLPAADVQLIVLTTSSPDHIQPATACITQHKIGAERAAAFDVMNVCSGFNYALSIGSKFVADGTYDNVLVVAAEAYSRILNYSDRTTCVFFGDGAGGVLLQPGPEAGYGVLSTFLGSDGSGHEVIQVPAGGARLPATPETIDAALNKFQMDGRAVWDFATREFPRAVDQAMEMAGLGGEKPDWVISHQANVNIIREGLSQLGLDFSNTHTTLERYGNTSSASIPVTLDEANRLGHFKRGDTLALVGFGGGLAWGANVVRWY
jgi:3-oxoacyl-[acyl-carrier-protein] synthase-3